MGRKIVIIGAGPSGLACSYALKKQNLDSIIYEKRSRWGGLCDNFIVKGFRFDRFVHLSFSEINFVNEIFFKTSYIKHIPNPYNYYKGLWIKHPVQSNMFQLPDYEKEKIIKGFAARRARNEDQIRNYEEWLKAQYGDYFAKTFPMKYTRKYWTTDAKNLGTEWIGKRLYSPTLEEIIQNSKKSEVPSTYYAKEMRYPEKGGYKSFLKPFALHADIRFNRRLIHLNHRKKLLVFDDGTKETYDILFSSIPLPEYQHIILEIPEKVKVACSKLSWTSAVLLSLCFNKPNLMKHLWFYVYDEDILPARIYSPSLKSPDNVPANGGSIQAEIYYSHNYKPLTLNLEQIKEIVINQLIDMGVFSHNDLVSSDVRIEPYANVIFDHSIDQNRAIIHDYLNEAGIIPVGRYGEWAYLWSDQSIMSGINAVKMQCGKKYQR